MKTLSIVGNCQGTALSRIMKYKYNLSNQYNIFLGRPVHVATLDDVKNIHNAIASSEIVILWDIQKGYRNNIGLDTDTLLSLCVKAEKIFITPTIYWNGLCPEIFYFKDKSNKSITNVFDYHNQIIFNGYLHEKSIDTVVNDFYDEESTIIIPDILLKNLNQLKERELNLAKKFPHASILSSSKYIIDNFTSKRLFWVMNHPSNEIFFHIAEQILMDTSVLKYTINDKKIEQILANSYFPIHPCIKKSLGINFLDVNDIKCRNVSYKLPDIIKKYYDFYNNYLELVRYNEMLLK